MSRAPAKALTEKQQAFVAEYLVDKNATQAAIRAGFSKKTAAKIASNLMKKPPVKAAIDAALAEQLKRVVINADRVLEELARVALTDISQAFDEDGKLKPLHEIPDDLRRSIASVETDELLVVGGDGEREGIGITRKLKLWDKLKALELLGKHHKLFTDKVEHSGAMSIQVVDPYAVPPKGAKR